MPTCALTAERDSFPQSGKLELLLPAADFARRFPAVAQWLPPAEAATLLASTRLVGVYCPACIQRHLALSLIR